MPNKNKPQDRIASGCKSLKPLLFCSLILGISRRQSWTQTPLPILLGPGQHKIFTWRTSCSDCRLICDGGKDKLLSVVSRVWETCGYFLGNHNQQHKEGSVLDYCKNMKRSFPRTKQKSIIKKYQRKARFSRNADILVRFFELLFQDLWKAGDKRFNSVQHLLLSELCTMP